jgi:hypothetical protein
MVSKKPTQEQIINADYGKYPDNYKEITTEFISRRLVDPYSAVFSDWKGPTGGWYGNYRNLLFGHRVCVSVNAKNRMGGYTGSSLFFVLIKNGQVIAEEGGDYKPGTLGEQMVYDLCNF